MNAINLTAPILVVTSCDDRAILEQISQQLLEKNLAACCQISGPIASHYRWHGELETSQEYLCSVKSIRASFAAIEQLVLELHSYEEPELVAWEISEGSKSYLRWLVENSSP